MSLNLVYAGDVNFRLIKRSTYKAHFGFDGRREVYKGRADKAEQFLKGFSPGSRVGGLVLQRAEADVGGRRFGTVTVEWEGIDAGEQYDENGNLITDDAIEAEKTEESILLQASSLITTTGESVQVQYYGYSVTSRKVGNDKGVFGYGNKPTATVELFNPQPANYSGNITGQFNTVNRCTQFQTVEIGRDAETNSQTWETIATWTTVIEPTGGEDFSGGGDD